MQLLYDHYIFAKQRYGGISRYFYEIISRISGFDEADVSLFLGLNNSGYDFSSKKFCLKNSYGKKIPHLNKVYILFERYNNFLFKKYIDQYNFNLLHKTYYFPVDYKFKGINIITIHDMAHEVYPEFFSEGDMTSYMKNESIKRADGIICVSKSTQEDLINILNVPREKTCVIYHGNSLRLEISENRIIEEPYILFVGQRWGYKNFNMLLTAFANSKILNNNLRLICFGGGSFNKSEILYMKEKNLEKKVIFLTGNDKKLGNLYKYASALVYPSFYEGFGFPPLEAMHFGCPVVSSYCSSIPEIVSDAGLYFNPYQIEDLIYKLELILSDSELRTGIIKRGFEREKEFDWNKCAGETFQFYKKMCEYRN